MKRLITKMQGFMTHHGRKMKNMLLILGTAVRLRLCRAFCCYGLTIGKKIILHTGTRLVLHNTAQVRLGDHFQAERTTTVVASHQASLDIGNAVYFNEGCMVSCLKQVTIGDAVHFAPRVMVFDNNHCFDAAHGILHGMKTRAVSIGNHCWLGANVTVLPGATIGEGCVIGAGCIIKGEIPPHTIVTAGHGQHMQPIH